MTDPAVSLHHNRQNLFARIWNKRGAYVYIFPTIGLLLLFMYYPALSALFHAFFKWDQFGDVYWIGLDNFRELYKQLFTARPGVESFYGMIQLVAWGAMGLLVAFFLLTEALREKSWAIPRTLAAAPTVIVAVVAGAAMGLVPAFEVGESIGADKAGSLQTLLLASLIFAAAALAASLLVSRRRWWMLIVQSALAAGAVVTAMLAAPSVESLADKQLEAHYVHQAVRALSTMAPWMLGAGVVLTALTRLNDWRLLKALAGGAWIAGVAIVVVSLAYGLAKGAASPAPAEAGDAQVAAAREIAKDFLLGHFLLLAAATGQMVGWLKQGRGRNPWWRRMYSGCSAAAIFVGVGLLVNLTVGEALRASCWNLARIMSFQLTVGLLVPLLIAEVLFHLNHEGSKYIYRVLFVIPMVVPGIVHLLMWQFIYNYDWGVLNKLVLVLKTPQAQGLGVLIFTLLWLYLTHMSKLGRRRAGQSTTIPLVWTFVILAAVALSVAGYAVGAAMGQVPLSGLAGWFYSIWLWTIYPFRNFPAVQLLVAAGAVAWLGWKAWRWREEARQMGAKPAGPYVILALLALAVVGAIVYSGFTAYGDMQQGAGDYIGQMAAHLSDTAGVGDVAAAEIEPQNWLGDSKIALYSIMMMGFPWVGTISMLIFYAGLQAIPDSVLESARLDGSTGLRRFFQIDFPLILGQFKLLLILGVIGGIQNFQQVLLLTYGGPSGSTEMPGLLMYKEAFEYARLGYGTTIGVMMFLVILVVTYVNMKYIRPSAEEN